MTSVVDPAGWLLIVATVVLALRWSTFSDDRWVRAIVVGGVLARTAYSLVNVVAGPIFGLGLDAQAFHLEAVGFAQGRGVSVGLVNGWVYSAFVGVLYKLTRGGLLLGQQLSVLAVVLSAASAVRIMRLLGVRAAREKWVLAVILFLPAGIINTSGTLREGAQQLFFLLTTEFALKTIDHPRVRNLAVMGAAVLLGGSLHGAVAVGGAAVAVGALIIAGCTRVPLRARQSSALRRVLPVAVVLVAFGAVSAPAVIFPYKIGGGGALGAATQFRNGTPPARADYLRFPPGTSIGVGDVPEIIGLYELAPLPWQVRTVPDGVAAVEALVRVILVLSAGFALVHVARSGTTRLLKALLLFGGWLTIELVWSLGTTNWGTASRHHIVGFPLLVLVSALSPPLVHRQAGIGSSFRTAGALPRDPQPMTR